MGSQAAVALDTVELIKGKTLEINFVLEESKITTDQIVVTGTRTAQKITDSPVMVNIMDGSLLVFGLHLFLKRYPLQVSLIYPSIRSNLFLFQ